MSSSNKWISRCGVNKVLSYLIFVKQEENFFPIYPVDVDWDSAVSLGKKGKKEEKLLNIEWDRSSRTQTQSTTSQLFFLFKSILTSFIVLFYSHIMVHYKNKPKAGYMYLVSLTVRWCYCGITLTVFLRFHLFTFDIKHNYLSNFL